MPNYAFIRLCHSLAEAQNLDESPEVEAGNTYLGQVHLLPQEIYPYWQFTDGDSAFIKGDSFIAYLVDECGDKEDISDHVTLQQFTDSAGISQLAFRLAYLPTDYGGELVYLELEITKGAEKITYYSNRFLVTNEGAELTARIDYQDLTREVNLLSNVYQSVRLNFYKGNFNSQTDVETYYQISRGQHVNPRMLTKELTTWKTGLWDGFTFKRLIRAFRGGPLYIDQERNYLYESPEYNTREGLSNVSENTFTTDPDHTDTITLNPVIVAGSYQDFRVNVPLITLNDPNNYLVTTIEIPA